jgi:hypothetical protein
MGSRLADSQEESGEVRIIREPQAPCILVDIYFDTSYSRVSRPRISSSCDILLKRDVHFACCGRRSTCLVRSIGLESKSSVASPREYPLRLRAKQNYMYLCTSQYERIGRRIAILTPLLHRRYDWRAQMMHLQKHKVPVNCMRIAHFFFTSCVMRGMAFASHLRNGSSTTICKSPHRHGEGGAEVLPAVSTDRPPLWRFPRSCAETSRGASLAWPRHVGRSW